MLKDATISQCTRYRYRLTRQWGDGRTVLFVMLNPSTADAFEDDPTIRKCIGFCRRWGAGGFEVVNLFAYRATKPVDLLTAYAPCGPDNDGFVAGAVHRHAAVVCAWGSPSAAGVRKMVAARAPQVRALLPEEVYCLGTSADGSPRHPLMLAYSTEVQAWR